jgi:conjugative transposon TraJ protein
MKNGKIIVIAFFFILGLLPLAAQAQGVANSIYGLHHVLENLFEEMIPLCSRMIDIGRAIAGFAALEYIAFRVWRHIAKAEPIDMFPLLRPFAICIVIILYPAFLGLMNGVLKPVVTATAAMGEDSQKAMLWHIQQEEESAKKGPAPGSVPGMQGNGQWQKYQEPDEQTDDQGTSSVLGKVFNFFNITSYLETAVRWLVGVLYATAGLCIDTIRTFYLIILAILGPLVLGLSVFDGFQQTLSTWIARYINVYMWLPVANIFAAITGKILENMMTLDQNFFSTVAYIIFMLISIVGYTTVPSVSSYIIHAGGKDTLLHKVNSITRQGAGAAAKLALMAI